MNQFQITDVPVEIEALARSIEVDGILVSLQCFWISQPSSRYQIRVSARGEQGVVDVPRDLECELDDQMVEVAVCFATAVKIRTEFYS